MSEAKKYLEQLKADREHWGKKLKENTTDPRPLVYATFYSDADTKFYVAQEMYHKVVADICEFVCKIAQDEEEYCYLLYVQREILKEFVAEEAPQKTDDKTA